MALLIKNLTKTFATTGGNISDDDLPKIVLTYDNFDNNRLISDELETDPLMLSMHASLLVA
jgi:hypothetical protein